MSLPAATIDKLAFGGNGVCRIDGKVCFVPFSCPGDEVTLRVTSQKKSYSTASIVDIVTPSSARTVPECKIFGRCGGCHWQHISYPVQLEQKRNILAEALWKGAGVPSSHIDETAAAALPYGYRNRLQFKVSVHNGKLRIGFYRQGTHQVEDVAGGCPVAAPVVNQVLNCFRGVLAAYPGVEKVTQLSVDSGDRGVIVFIQQQGAVTRAMRNYLCTRSAGFGPCTGLYLKTDAASQGEKIWGDSDIVYRMPQADPDKLPLLLAYPPGGFAQVHQRQNVSMLTRIRTLGSFSGTERLLDLYCGNGNFSIPLAADVAAVIGVEGSADSVAAAEQNRIDNTVANACFFCDDAAAAVQRFVDENQRFDVVLLDPPRAGAGDVVAGIARLQPSRIIYVSCDPSTLARDCGLLAGCGYHVVTSVPVDMFPQTFHIESVTLLYR